MVGLELSDIISTIVLSCYNSGIIQCVKEQKFQQKQEDKILTLMKMLLVFVVHPSER